MGLTDKQLDKHLKAIKPDLEKRLKKRMRWMFFSMIFLVTFIGVIPVMVILFTSVKIDTSVKLMNEIKKTDKRRLDALFAYHSLGKTQMIAIINKLIETKNLEGYEVIGDVGIAKTELHAAESDFEVAPPVYTQVIIQQPLEKRPNNCPNCGAAIKEDSGKFCPFCGTRV